MNNDDEADGLLHELSVNPRKFDEQGRAYQLLQVFFRGLPVETLRPLLQNPDPLVQRTGGFVASELGCDAATLVYDVVALLTSPDIHAQNYAMEVLTVCGLGEKAGLFAHVLRKLESDHGGLRLQAMDLVSNANAEQLAAAVRFFEHPDSDQEAHSRGIRALLAGREVPSEAIAAMVRDQDPLIRRYGAILARRSGQVDARIISEIRLGDSELREFFAKSVSGLPGHAIDTSALRPRVSTELDVECFWVPKALGGLPTEPYVGMRPTIRWQQYLREHLKRPREAEYVNVIFDPDTLRGSATVRMASDAPLPTDWLQEGCLVELLDGHKVIAVGRIITARSLEIE